MQTINLPGSFYDLGDHRKFKYLSSILNNQEQVIEFFIKKLNYKKYEVNKIAYDVKYRKQRYIKTKMNRLVNPHITS